MWTLIMLISSAFCINQASTQDNPLELDIQITKENCNITIPILNLNDWFVLKVQSYTTLRFGSCYTNRTGSSVYDLKNIDNQYASDMLKATTDKIGYWSCDFLYSNSAQRTSCPFTLTFQDLDLPTSAGPSTNTSPQAADEHSTTEKNISSSSEPPQVSPRGTDHFDHNDHPQEVSSENYISVYIAGVFAGIGLFIVSLGITYVYERTEQKKSKMEIKNMKYIDRTLHRPRCATPPLSPVPSKVTLYATTDDTCATPSSLKPDAAASVYELTTKVTKPKHCSELTYADLEFDRSSYKNSVEPCSNNYVQVCLRRGTVPEEISERYDTSEAEDSDEMEYL